MNNILKITIEGQPSPKQRSRMGINKRWYNPQSDFMNILKRNIKQQLPEKWIIIKKNVPVICNITFFFKPSDTEFKKKNFVDLIADECYPYIKKKDRDNLDKLILDCMSKIVFYDDAQVYGGELWKYYSMNPRTEIEVEWNENE